MTVDAGARTAEALVILDRHGMDFGPSGASRYESGIEAGGELARERWPGIAARERRTTQGPDVYAGPERRLVGVLTDRGELSVAGSGRMAKLFPPSKRC